MKNNIKKLRNEMKISQKDLAQSLSVSRQTINAIETGKFDPSLTLSIKISRFFKKGLEEILRRTRNVNLFFTTDIASSMKMDRFMYKLSISEEI